MQMILSFLNMISNQNEIDLGSRLLVRQTNRGNKASAKFTALLTSKKRLLVYGLYSMDN